MIGMRAFIADPPSGINELATVLPVQIFLWSDEVDRAFVENTRAAIIVLLVFMLGDERARHLSPQPLRATLVGPMLMKEKTPITPDDAGSDAVGSDGC